MVWTVIRIDFTEKCVCIFGEKKHYITSGKAYVVVNEQGVEAFCGPQCAKNPNYVKNPDEKVPDLTKGCLDIDIKDQNASTCTNPNNKKPASTNKQELNHNKAIAYLLLRVQKLSHYPQIRYAKLDDIYNRYISNQIADNDIIFLLKLIESPNYPEYSYKNLQAIYACDFWINQFLRENTDKNTTFIESIKKYLFDKLALTPSQIEGLNSWFDNTNRRKMINIKPNAFVINPTTYWKIKTYACK